MFLSLKTLYRKRTVIWPFYFYTIIRTLSPISNNIDFKKLFSSNHFKNKNHIFALSQYILNNHDYFVLGI